MKDEIIFYTTNCPKCFVLKSKLDTKKIEYTVEDDVDKMLAMGIEQAPMLGINGHLYSFAEAVNIINNL